MRLKTTIGGTDYFVLIPSEASGSWGIPERGPPAGTVFERWKHPGTVVPTRDGGMLGQAQESDKRVYDFSWAVMENGGTLADIGGGDWGGTGWLGLEDFYNRVQDAGTAVFFDWVGNNGGGYFAGAPLSAGFIGNQAVGPVSFRLVDSNVNV